jgi:protein SCO1/2
MAGAPDVHAAESALEKSEAVIGKQLPNYQLLGQDGRYFALHSFRGKYLLVSFIYTSCPGPCVAISQSVRNLFSKMNPAVVKKVRALSISFDTLNDTPQKLEAYGKEFTDSFDAWTFARADEVTTKKIAEGLGFFYEKKAPGWYEHMNRLTLVGPDMKPIRNFYGTDFDPAQVGGAIKASLEGRSVKSSMMDSLSRVMLFCSEYDGDAKTYKVNYMFLFSVLVQYLLVLGTVVYFLWDHITGLFNRIFKGRSKSAN